VTTAASIAASFLRCTVGLLSAGVVLAGCTANKDFDQLRPMLVTDNIHAWVGASAAQTAGLRSSNFELTDDERLMRDLAYPLIEAPYDRNRWFSVLNEYGLTRVFKPNWWFTDVTAYSNVLMSKPYRSAAGRYERINDDVRNDVVRIPPFFDVARRVLDTDKRRGQALGMVGGLNEYEAANARSRMAENYLVVGWVQCSLTHRGAAYRFALERLVIEAPTSMAVEVDRSLKLMQIRATENRAVPMPEFCGVEPVEPVAVEPGPRVVSKG
jgi:hypothetical protein